MKYWLAGLYDAWLWEAFVSSKQKPKFHYSKEDIIHHPKYLSVSSWNQPEWANTLRIIQAHMCLSVHTSLLHPDCFVSVESPAGFHVAWLFDIPSIIDLSQLYIIPTLCMLLLNQKWNTFYKLNVLFEIRDTDFLFYYRFSSFSLCTGLSKLLLLLLLIWLI